MNTATLTVRVRPEIARRLGALAKATQRTKSFLAAEAIEEYLSLQEWQVEVISKGIEEADRDEGVDLDEVRLRWERKLADSPDNIGGA